MQLAGAPHDDGPPRRLRRHVGRGAWTAPGDRVPWPSPVRRRCLPEHLQDWAVFQPNAPGRAELWGPRAIQRRQLLKAESQYLAERVLITVGITEVALWPLLPGGVAGRCLGRYARGSLLAVDVEASGPTTPMWPAFVLMDRRRERVVAELRAVQDDRPSRVVVDLLAGR